MKLGNVADRIDELLREHGPDAELVVYDTESGEFVRDVSFHHVEMAEATETIKGEHGVQYYYNGDLIKMDDVTRPLAEGKSTPIVAVEVMF